jgi:hypothetical protein
LRLSTYFLLVPVIVIAAALAVANREMVPLSLDPFSDAHPALVIQMPLFMLLFFTLLLGVLIGGMVALFSRRKRSRPQPEREMKESKALIHIDPREKPKEAA